jgi:hypothetical protein
METARLNQLVLSLIKDDLVNLRLIYGLQAMGIHADGYMLHLSNTVFALMGFDDTDRRTDAIHDHYIRLSQKIAHIDIHEAPELLDELAREIYVYLRTSCSSALPEAE